MATTNDSLVGPPDFSEPWKFSDVVLVVEDQKFHVHRSTLSIWSPVFETMFTSMFKEKNMHEIPLPGKKASEIKELLLIIYPNVSETGWNTVTNENCYFLGELAEEYQMDAIMQRCEKFLVEEVSRMSGNTFLTHLTFAQTHKLEKLIETIINKASGLSLDDFKSHEDYDKMDLHTYKQIVEKMIRRLEGILRPGMFPYCYAMASTTNDSLVGSPDFSEPWKFSDVVLVVEDQKFHVHRSTLSIWSPVFETMFTSMFKEKNMHEIPLPGKKASEIKELLLIIYPTVSETGWNTVTKENCYFLGELAEEYQMDAIMQRCEKFLVEEVSRTSGNTFLTHLTFAQTHKLEKLIKTIIDKASGLSLDDFKSHEKYDNMDPHLYKQIVEKMTRRLEGAVFKKGLWRFK